MAIVDIKHTQTIEEMLRSGESGGGTSATIIQFNYNEVLGSGGFVKKQEGPTFEYYTLAEIQELYEKSNGMLLAYDTIETEGASPSFIKVEGNHAYWNLFACYTPESIEDENLYFTSFGVFLTSEGYSIHKHTWYTAITNDD